MRRRTLDEGIWKWKRKKKEDLKGPDLETNDNIKIDVIDPRRCAKVEFGVSLSRYWPVVGCYEHGNESTGYIKFEEFLDRLSDCRLLKRLFSRVTNTYTHNEINRVQHLKGRRGSVVSIAPRLRAGGPGVRILVGTTASSLLQNVKTDPPIQWAPEVFPD